MIRTMVLRTLLLASLLSIDVHAQLAVSANNRYITQNGEPIHFTGTAAWALTNLTLNDAKLFMDSCFTHNINWLEVSFPNPSGFGGPANGNGANPWSGSQTFASAINEPYWAYIDSLVDYAETKGIYFNVYMNTLGGSDIYGFNAEIAASSAAVMKAWGEFIGNRFASRTNIIYTMGEDANPTSYMAKMESTMVGIRNYDTDALISGRAEQETTVDTYWPPARMSFGGIYPYWTTYEVDRIYTWGWDEYNRIPVKPSRMAEGWYINEHDPSISAVGTRTQAWYGLLAGLLVGQTFGTCPVWTFGFSDFGQPNCTGLDWKLQLDDAGMVMSKHYSNLVNSRYWYKLIPDTAAIFLTSGYGTGQTRALAAKANDGSSIIAYSPDSKTLTFNPTTMTGDSVRVYLFNPATGGVTFVGNEETGDNFTVATTGERVVVIDSEVFDNFFDAPGGEPPLPRKKVMAYYNQWLQQLSPSWKVPWQIDWSGIDYVVHFYDGDAVFTNPPYLRVLKDSAFGGTHTLPDSILIQHWFTDCGLGCYPVNYQDSLIKYVHLAGGKVLFDLQDVVPDNLNVVMSDSTASQVLADGTIAYIKRKGYDGYEIDSESWSVPTPGDEEAGYARFVRMTNRIDPNMEVFISASTGAWNDWNLLDTSLVGGWVIQTYELEFAWDSDNSWNANWYGSPLFSTGVPPQINGQSINTLGPPQWVNTTGVPKQKMWIGIPAYGRQLLGSNDGLFERWTGGITYDSYATITGLSGTKFFDDNAKVPRIEHGTSFATFEDSLSIWWKMKYVMDSSYAGVFVYDMDNDGANRKVLNWSMQIRDNFSEGAAASVPTVTTTAISNVTTTTMSSGGDVTSDGGATVTVRGICWSYTGTPTVADNTTSDGTGTGSYTSSITGLQGNKTVYVRAYATNSVGDGYGTEVNSTTLKYMGVLK